MSTYASFRNEFASVCEQVGFTENLRDKALASFDQGVAVALELILEEEGLFELAGKGKLQDILAHHASKEDEYWQKLKGRGDKAPLKRQSAFTNWKKHGAKAARAASLLNKIKEDTEALASVAGNSLADYRGTSDDDPRTWPERLEAELNELLQKLEALQAEIELSKDGLSRNVIKKYSDALRKAKGPSAKETVRSGDKIAQLENATDVFERNRLKREIMHEQFTQSVKDWNVRMLSNAGIYGKDAMAKKTINLDANTEWLKKRMDRKDHR